MGEIAAIDDEAARVPLERGEIVLVEEEKGFICDVCEKECKSKAGLNAHKRTHEKKWNKEMKKKGIK